MHVRFDVLGIWKCANTFLKILGIAQLFNDIILSLACVSAAVVLHQQLLNGVLHSPLQFFDTNPTGRILSRFSSDVEVIDDELPWYFTDGEFCLFEVLMINLLYYY